MLLKFRLYTEKKNGKIIQLNQTNSEIEIFCRISIMTFFYFLKFSSA